MDPISSLQFGIGLMTFMAGCKNGGVSYKDLLGNL